MTLDLKHLETCHVFFNHTIQALTETRKSVAMLSGLKRVRFRIFIALSLLIKTIHMDEDKICPGSHINTNVAKVT